MVWIRAKRTILGKTKPVKKFSKGRPDPQYFGGGMWHMQGQFDKVPTYEAYEVFPHTTKPKLEVHPKTLFAIEVWKEPGSSRPRIIAICKKDKANPPSTVESLGRTAKSDRLAPKGMPNDVVRLDVELAHQINFAEIIIGDVPLLDRLVRAAAKAEYAWIQAAVRPRGFLTEACENATIQMNAALHSGKKRGTLYLDRGLIPRAEKPSEPEPPRGNVADMAGLVKNAYVKRQHESLCALSLRAVCSPAARGEISDTLESVILSGDSLRAFSYADHPAFDDIMAARMPLIDGAAEALFYNAGMWRDPRWGSGQTMSFTSSRGVLQAAGRAGPSGLPAPCRQRPCLTLSS